jgi:uncharacterized protein YdeI (YjbR/CyaY-like superfamily)
MKPRFFRTSADFRKWLERHHDTTPELWVGFYKKSSGKPSISYPESVDEALCFGWIDGVRRTIDDISYMNRFTPRRVRSNWSAINVKRVDELTKLGRMRPPGVRAFEARNPKPPGLYSYEQRKKYEKLASAYEAKLKANAKAWTFFQSQPPGYRRIASLYVMSAKKEETRLRRLAILIDDSAHQRRIGLMQRPAK